MKQNAIPKGAEAAPPVIPAGPLYLCLQQAAQPETGQPGARDHCGHVSGYYWRRTSAAARRKPSTTRVAVSLICSLPKAALSP